MLSRVFSRSSCVLRSSSPCLSLHFGTDTESTVVNSRVAEAKAYLQHGLNLTRTGKRDLALMRFRKALDTINRTDGHCGKDVSLVRAAASSNLATTLREMFRKSGDLNHATESATLFSAAVTDLESSVGPEHIRVAKVLQDFAVLLEMVDDAEGVEAALRRALTVHANWDIRHKKEQDMDIGRSACERLSMMLPLATACKSQGKTEEVDELEDPFFKCVEVAVTADADNLAGALTSIESFMGLTGKDKSEIEFAITLLKSLKKEKETPGGDNVAA